MAAHGCLRTVAPYLIHNGSMTIPQYEYDMIIFAQHGHQNNDVTKAPKKATAGRGFKLA